MSELQPFFDAILAAPDDEAPRLALAKHLVAKGDPRGEQIQLACEIEHLEHDDPKRIEIEQRLRTLPQFLFFTNRNFHPIGISMRRGFVETINCTVEWFVAKIDELMRDAPIREYQPRGGDPAVLAAHPALAKLRHLDLWYTHKLEDIPIILASPHLANLRELSLQPWFETVEMVDKVATWLRPLKGLRVLRLFGHLRMETCRPIALLAKELKLELIHFIGWVPPPGLAGIYEILGEDRVLPRREPPYRFRFGKLDFSNTTLSTAEIRDLIDSGTCSEATKIVLSSVYVDDVIGHLAPSGKFPAVRGLHLYGITDVGARALVESAVGLDSLEDIDLGDVPVDGRSGVSDSVVEELARSPKLPALRSITRHRDWRNYDGREGKEIVVLHLPDGRVVENIIWHSMP